MPLGSRTKREGGQPEPPGDEAAEHRPVAPAEPVHRRQRREHLEAAREREPEWRPERQQEHHEHLRLADDEAPRDRTREPAEHVPRPAVADAGQPDRRRERDQHHDHPDRGRDLERQERERPERDRQERRVEVVVRAFDRRRLLVQRLAGVQPRARVVVGVDVGRRIGRRVQDEDVRADQARRATANANATRCVDRDSTRRSQDASSIFPSTKPNGRSVQPNGL